MPIKPRSTPGPRAESCLTCRQRKKKCDKVRPFCLRCLNSKGTYTCLGYDNETHEPGAEKVVLEERTTIEPTIILPWLTLGVEFRDTVPGPSTGDAYFDSLMLPSPPKSSTLAIDLLLNRPDQGVGREPNVKRYRPGNIVTLPAPDFVPRGVRAEKQMRESYFMFIMKEYQRHRIIKFFRPSTDSRQGYVTVQLSRPRLVGYMYLGAKIFETFVGKPEEKAIQLCSQWVRRYANHVTNPEESSNPFPSTQEVEDKLDGLLHLALLLFIVLGTAAGYATFRLALPNALRLLSENPNFWTEQEHNRLLCISLPNVLTSNRVGIHRFILQDVLYSLVLGIPTLAEYDSTGLPTMAGVGLSADWFHDVQGVPAEMVIIIAEVHSWRAQTKYVDWCELEMRTWAWDHRDPRFEHSDEMIYRTAIQEAWRHTTLIYIYMGICGASSHDPRVQSSVYQIVKLIGVVGDAVLDGHLSAPCVVAGVASRYEHQRALVFHKLNSFNGVRTWILRGRDFAQVLDHLWHGPAMGGAAVLWDDYVQARCMVLPL